MVTGQTPGQLIDLHYVNYDCDAVRRMKNGSHCSVHSECTLLSFLLTSETVAWQVMALLNRVSVRA